MEIAPETRKILGDMVELGFVKNLRVNKILSDEPQINIVFAGFGDLLGKAGIALPEKSAKKGFSGNDFFDLDNAVMACLGEAVERTCLYFAKYKKYGNNTNNGNNNNQKNN